MAIAALVSLLLMKHACAFNLDTKETIVKKGPADSFFGFSVALHRQASPQAANWLVVGAPKAEGLSHQGAKSTGGMYRCPITDSTSDCERVIFDNDVDATKESKEDQWMGVTVRSQGYGGKLMACAHRYEKRQYVGESAETRSLMGRCYVLSQNFKIDEKDEMDGGGWKFCDHRTLSHARFGVCQQGTDAAFTPDFHYVYFGAPGAYHWKGVVHASQKNNTFYEMDIFNDGPYETGDENKHREELVPVPYNSYLGFSVDSAKGITDQKRLSFVAGAPRTNHTGAVMILKIKPPHMLEPEQIIYGEELASSFGYDVTVVDLNNDGWQDLVVGAPQYFDRKNEIGGAVYVYMNLQGSYDERSYVRLDGAKDSMFGLAVANIKDINLDKFEDIAVGAPYDGEGKVFIFLGKRSGLEITPTQIISGSELQHRIQQFGYSISGGIDMDNNVYPDVLVGSLSDKVALLRARPVILPTVYIVSIEDIDMEKKTCKNGIDICMKVQACLSYKAKPDSYNAAEDIKDKLRAIPVELSYHIKEASQHQPLQVDHTLSPVLDVSTRKPVTAKINFIKEGCGDDNICQSEMSLRYYYCSHSEDDTFDRLKRVDGHQVLSLKDQKTLALEVEVENTGDDAYEAHFQLVLPHSVSYGGHRKKEVPEDFQLVCWGNENGSLADCDLGNPMKRDQRISFYMILGTSGINVDTYEINPMLKLNTTSEQPGLKAVEAKLKVVIELSLAVTGVVRPIHTEFGGEVKGESAMKTEDDVGSLIEYKFQVMNTGKSIGSLGNAYINISWPAEITNGKWLLYLVNVTVNGTLDTSCHPGNRINELNLQSIGNEYDWNRERRHTHELEPVVSESKVERWSSQREKKVLDCLRGTARCWTLQCSLTGMEQSATVLLRARLWSSTFLEEFDNISEMEVITRAKIGITTQGANIIMKNAKLHGYLVRLMVSPEMSIQPYQSIPWWIILLAVLAGILMLALLILLLWKCGFFKRTTHEMQYEAKYHKAKIEVQPSEKEKMATEA
uniref:Integrin subunit alpha 6 n=1 Tax=Eptatretus burgeri TaxID=7764 RepID=A0A8C4N444_EPTBU